MKWLLRLALSAAVLPGAACACPGAPAAVDDRVDWQDFLAQHDLVWNTLPGRWREAAFLGNGMLGLMIYQPAEPHGGHFFGWTYRPEEKNSLRFDVGRRDVCDHRDGRRTLVDEARLPIGHFLLTPVGTITGGDMRLDLWNAEARGTLITDRGRIAWRAVILSERNAIVIDVGPSPGERACVWRWVPAISESTRLYKWKRGGYGADRPQDKYPANPPAERKTAGPCDVSVQPMLAGGDYTTAWKTTHPRDGLRRIYVSVGYSHEDGRSAEEATSAIEAASDAPYSSLEKDHRRWWHDYYRQSFLSIPDPRLESFYWIQMYKLAAATRADLPAMDLMGPWFKTTIWPGMWWNLNLQLSYYPVYTANRLEIGESLCRMLDANVDNLVANARDRFGDLDLDRYGEAALVARVTAGSDLQGGMFKGQRGAPEVGNLTWALHNYWRQCRYAGDDRRLREAFLPLLRRAVNLYLAMLVRDDGGTYHLPPTYSPECGYGPDCNYDLALLAWGCRVLAAECERLGIDDPLLPRWKDVIANLADYPTDENGFMLARGVPFGSGHRHYSHLLMIYPLRLVHWGQGENRRLIQRSVEHWAGRQAAFSGYSFTGAASMYASMDRGDKALAYLHDFLARSVTPNTMSLEAESPVIETPLSAAESSHDMLLQSWSDWAESDRGGPSLTSTIRVFPGMPVAWKDAVFHDLRAENAFLVSARRESGHTQWVRVMSLAGKPCRIKPGFDGDVRVLDATQDNRVFPLGSGVYELHLDAGEEIVLHSSNTLPSPIVTPVDGPTTAYNYFGSRQANRD